MKHHFEGVVGRGHMRLVEELSSNKKLAAGEIIRIALVATSSCKGNPDGSFIDDVIPIISSYPIDSIWFCETKSEMRKKRAKKDSANDRLFYLVTHL